MYWRYERKNRAVRESKRGRAKGGQLIAIKKWVERENNRNDIRTKNRVGEVENNSIIHYNNEEMKKTKGALKAIIDVGKYINLKLVLSVFKSILISQFISK